MIGLDTNVLLRWLVDETVWPDDAPEQTALVAATLARRDTRFFVNVVVLVETVWVLTKPLQQRKPVLTALIGRLLQGSNVVVDHREAVEAALATWVAGSGEFSDHLIGAINATEGCQTTLTFDRVASRSPAFTRLHPEP